MQGNSIPKKRTAPVVFLCALMFFLGIAAGWFARAVFNPSGDSPAIESVTITPSMTPPAKTSEPVPAPTIKEEPTTPAPAVQPTLPPVLEEYRQYKDNYKDFAGWIKVSDVGVDYPVMQSDDNDYYLEHTIDGQKDTAASMTLDFRNTQMPYGNRNTIIYGHNMKSGKMFGQLKKYLGKKFFDEHRLITYDTPYLKQEWEIFAAYVVPIDFYFIQTDFESDTEWLNFILECQRRSAFETEVTLTAEDEILTLCTCTSEGYDYRFVVQARLIKEGN